MSVLLKGVTERGVIHQLCWDHEAADARQKAIDGASRLPVRWARYEVDTMDSRTAVQMAEMAEKALPTGAESGTLVVDNHTTGATNEV